MLWDLERVRHSKCCVNFGQEGNNLLQTSTTLSNRLCLRTIIDRRTQPLLT